ncbi:hypothetical protein [Herbaspirillum huttiense]|uniref:Uncharacterized protein n=1 Tax=Herbaspirillum huttiense subsp. lycopersici TaxID=3074428 RepID=A0ABU2EUL3_9BURK|nr:hypothetical protein [Herbaspirillum huttiense]MDR9851841.1 hypothetical protein [Herbaspirillum huttiense SE1]
MNNEKNVSQNALSRMAKQITDSADKRVVEDARKLSEKLQIEREELLKRIDKHEFEFAKREDALMRRELSLRKKEEDFQAHQSAMAKAQEALDLEVIEYRKKMADERAALDAEKQRYTQESKKQIQQKSEKYVSQALDSLGLKEKGFHRFSAVWSGIGALSIFGAFIISGWATLRFIPDLSHSLSWEYLSFISIRGLVLVGLSLALARYSFLLSERYIKEALKNAERRHAIRFGAFYLDSYGAAADWNQVKEAFKDWNISLSKDANDSNRDSNDESNFINLSPQFFENLNKLVALVPASVKKEKD